MKVLLLNNVPAPYFLPLFGRLGAEPDWQLTVCYTSSWNSTVGWQNSVSGKDATYRVVVLDQINETLSKYVGSSLSAALMLISLIFKERPDYLICYGYTLKPQVFLLCWAVLTGASFALIGDANYFFDQADGLRRFVKSIWLRFVAKRASALIEIGIASRLFWEKYGATPAQLFKSHLVVDNDYFFQASNARADEAKSLRSQYGFDGKVVFLFVGRLIQRKNVGLIIRAARLIDLDSFGIVIAGDGEQAEELKRLAGDESRIVFLGNVPQGDLPIFYKMADVLVLPADQEPWGLVINEAMACGLAIIAHQYCGASMDLVDVDNGIKLQCFSDEELAKAMKLLIRDQALLRAMQVSSRAKIQLWSIESAAEGIIQAVMSTYRK
ncbi:MAG TPA: glycosyltransferase family 4 protein [Blastocatellia bacterium]|nr:glycosyltransferase family 4 protein [Blastocatellia bacterium]